MSASEAVRWEFESLHLDHKFMSKKEYDRAWYAANKARIRSKLNGQNTARRAALKARVDAYKTALGCSRCPENRPACLDFHHVDPATKCFAIGNAIRMNLCWEA